MTWEPEIEEMQLRLDLAKKMGGEANIKRQHDGGKLTIRERVESLVDDDTFDETGALAGKAEYDDDGNITDFLPANFVMGFAQINNRQVVIGGDDFTVRGRCRASPLSPLRISAMVDEQ